MTAVRPAQREDLDGVMAVWSETEGITGDNPPLPLYMHELETGTLVVADDDGTVVGFGAVLERGGSIFLADLFVRPDRQSSGLGRAILDTLFQPRQAAPRYTSASADPRAQRLYRGFGMVPRFEIDHLRADTAPDIRAVYRYEVAPVDATTAARHHAWTGIDRTLDLAYWGRLGASVVTVHEGRAVVGHGFVFPHTPWSPFGDRTVVGQVITGPGADSRHVTATVFAAMAGLDDRADQVMAFVPRPHPAHRFLVEAGMTVFDSDAFMASDGAEFDSNQWTAAPDIN